MGYIYKITNIITDKSYIGKTIYSINHRWRQHIDNSKKDSYQRYELYRDMKKYGIENFNIVEIEKVDDHNLLSQKEKYWISYYDTFINGYNNTLGGDGEPLYNYDVIWSLWEDGYKIKEISKKIGCNDFVVRTVLDFHDISTEERMARSYDDQIKTRTRLSRKVRQINIHTGEVLKEYPSISAAAKELEKDSSYLGKVCRKNGEAYGYKWEFVNNEYIKRDFTARKVGQVDLGTNEIIAVYDSISEAARSVDGDSSYIGKVCRGIQKSSKGYGWVYIDN